nr:immunoglobulin light chain junction region [Macaca mulatta]MOV94841.1 immunoglobulin light chain junction region [Macaca mulatta]MOV98310.1 immunoglobulin light chain junction region [Macaca mulatta]MOV98911.1 immunoglobulin light chain junction region [Macaca mulatta]MOV99351.1 immunoglobulin light chain junction region [Macaca mulatta]
DYYCQTWATGIVLF